MKKILFTALSLLLMGAFADAQPKLEDYFSPCSAAQAAPDKDGFVRRWTLLDPIPKPELRSNASFNDSFLREEFAKVYFKDQTTMIPKDGQRVRLEDKSRLYWHSFDSKNYNVKLYRFASGLGLRPTEGLFLAFTVINVEKDVTVRMSVGSNSGSMWWVNGEEAILLSGDRRMVVDDCVSRKITLKAGKNFIRGSVINGPGMSDFCIRFFDADGNVFKDFTVTNE